MDRKIQEQFTTFWGRYFNDAELPIVFYYTDKEDRAEKVKPGTVARCIIGALAKVRQGKSLSFSGEAIGCFGGRRYLGFATEIRPDFEYFLSCGIPGKLEGERYKKSPGIVKKSMEYMPAFKAPAKYIVFKRWDKLVAADNPEVVIFFAPPDVLSGLFTLHNYDRTEPNGVIAPFGSGCSSIVSHPYREVNARQPHAVLGMFDVSARPFVAANELTFAVPMKRLAVMLKNAEQSFLITKSWKAIRKRTQKY